METANQLLRDWRDINKARGSKTLSQSRQQTASTYASQYASPLPPTPEVQMDQLGTDMERTRIGEPTVPPKMADYSYGRQQTQSPARETAAEQRAAQLGYPSPAPPPGRPVGGRPPVQPPFPTEPQSSPVRPMSGGYEVPPGSDAYGYQVHSSFVFFM